MVCSIQELLELVQKRQTAVLLETMQYGTLSYQPIIDKPSSKDYMLMKQEVYWQDTVIMASKTWPFMEQLNRIVFMQMESGIKYYWELTVNGWCFTKTAKVTVGVSVTFSVRLPFDGLRHSAKH